MAQSKRTIRASEIGSFLYCQRAWWYRRNNVPAINSAEMAGGEQFHRMHSSQTRGARWLRAAAWTLLILAVLYLLLIVF